MGKEVIINFEGKQEEAIELTFSINGSDSIEIDLEDKSSLTLKPIIFKVLKLKNRKSIDDQPVYLVNSQIFVSATNINLAKAER